MNTPEQDTLSEEQARHAGVNIVTRLLGRRIAVFGTTEDGDLLLGALGDDGRLVEIIISVEDGALTICEVSDEVPA